jgi:hypothetical protein
MDKESDHDRILQGNPWIFRNSWLIVKPWDRDTDLQSLDFDHAPIWVQLWGLPTHCKTKEMGESLGSLLGSVEASEFYEYPGKKMIIKIKVSLNVHKPITPGIHVGNPNDGSCWIDYRYEKLPLFCFKCGLIGHAEKLCRNKPMTLGTLAPLGPWIQSTQYGKRKMEAKDRKYYSNPSHDPNFGKNSPPVPTSLLEKLAAMKLQTPKGNEQKQSNQQQNQYTHLHTQQLQTCSSVQDKIMSLNANSQRLHHTRNLQIAEVSSNGNQTSEGTKQHQSTPAKRQKMESENAHNNDTAQMDYQRVGHAQQASPMP